jgi:SpoVK/Ycf46/Vps4 family AAA+-type ATPase
VARGQAAGAYRVPLLRLDFGALYTKWHGESERNLRETLATADAMAPCVLWLDEIEKGVAAGDGDSGTSKRVLGTPLTWLADKTSRVFVVATANDIAALPPAVTGDGGAGQRTACLGGRPRRAGRLAPIRPPRAMP